MSMKRYGYYAEKILGSGPGRAATAREYVRDLMREGPHTKENALAVAVDNCTSGYRSVYGPTLEDPTERKIRTMPKFIKRACLHL